ncbi:cell division protein SepF [Candidatus Stoquefichus massiliensis]|uniref:cell division protein SepF n=1 Tax=Candidatus Stoquefichus massiliensis TaxID=1470350 RepID=UPI0004BA4C8C|nr:cell division protein SepF [Candidatus Stoquefichus massiliensis]
MKEIIYKLRSYSEAVEVLDQLQAGYRVILDIENVERTEAQRVIDFLCGGIYIINGQIQQINSFTYLCLPKSEININEEEQI